MARTTLQIPLETTLRDRAEQAAIIAGFSSVQEVIRVFLSKFASQSIKIGFFDTRVQLSKKAEARYSSMIDEAKQGKNVVRTKILAKKHYEI